MKIDELQRKLLAAARALPISDQVPYSFEKRIMAALAANPAAVDVWAFWSRLLWRAAAPCVGIMLVLGVWSVFAANSGSSSASLAADFDRTVWGPLVSLNESW
jgi:hypothetical protein